MQSTETPAPRRFDLYTLAPLLSVLAFGAVWSFVVWLEIWPDWLLPGPLPVLERLGESLFKGEVW